MQSIEDLLAPTPPDLSDLLAPSTSTQPVLKGNADYSKERNLREIAYGGPEYTEEITPERQQELDARDMRQWEEAYANPRLNEQQRAILLAHKPKPTKAPGDGYLGDLLKADPNDLSDLLKDPGYGKAFMSGLDSTGAALNRSIIGMLQVLPGIPDQLRDQLSEHFRNQSQELDKSVLSPEEQANATFGQKLAQGAGSFVGMSPGLVGGLPGAAATAGLAAFGNKAKEVEEGLSTTGAIITTPINVMVDAATSMMPIFGSSPGKAAVIGAITNPLTGMLEDAVNKVILSRTGGGDKQFAERYNPLDLEQRFVEAIFGGATSYVGKRVDIAQGRASKEELEHIMDAFRQRFTADIDTFNQNIVHHDFSHYESLKSNPNDRAGWQALVNDLLGDIFPDPQGRGIVQPSDKIQVMLDYVVQHGQTDEQKAMGRYLSSIWEFVSRDEDFVLAIDDRGFYNVAFDSTTGDVVHRQLGLNPFKSSPKTFIHEMQHLLTAEMIFQVIGDNRINAPIKRTPQTPEEERVHSLVNDLNDFYLAHKDQLRTLARETQDPDYMHEFRKRYGTTDLHEFLAELSTSQIFRDQLDKIKFSPDTASMLKTKFMGDNPSKFILAGRKLSDFKDKSLLDLALFHYANLIDAMTSGHRFGAGGASDFEMMMRGYFGKDIDIEDYALRHGQRSLEAQMSDVLVRRIGQILAMTDNPDGKIETIKGTVIPKIMSLVPDPKSKELLMARMDKIMENAAKYTKAWADFTYSDPAKAKMTQDMRTITKIVDDIFKGKSRPEDDMSSSGTYIFGADQLSMIKDKTKGGQLIKAFNDKINEYRRFKKQLYHDFLNFQQKFVEMDFEGKKEVMVEARFWDQMESRRALEMQGLMWPTEEMQRQRGLSQAAIDAYQQMAKGYDYMWNALNGAGKTIPELNVDGPFNLQRIPGFMPHFHEGNVKIRVKVGDKVIMMGRDTIFGAKRLIKKIQKMNDPDIQLLPDPHTGKAFTLRADRSPALSISTALVDNYNSYKNWSSLDPVLGTRVAQLDIDDSRGYIKTFLERKNIQGYTNAAIGGLDTKEMKSYFGIPNKAADDVFGIYERYARSASDFIANSHFVNDVTRPLLAPSTEDYHIGRQGITKNLPNTVAYLEAQTRNFTGENLNAFKWVDDKLEKLAVGLQLHPHYFKFLNRGVRGLLSMVKLRTVRNWVANIQQPMNGLGMLYHFAVDTGLQSIHSKTSPMESIGWAYKELLMNESDEGRFAMQWARDNHIVEAQQTFEIHADRRIESPLINKIDKMLLGGVNERIERFSRMATFLTSYHYMKQFYNNRVNALEAADRATRAIMVNYDPAARPHMYQNFGVTGEFLSPFAVYRNAYLGNTYLMLRDIARNPTKLENWRPFLVGQAVYLLQAGMIGMIGIAEYDFIASQWNEYMPDDTMKLPTSSEWTFGMPDWLSFGVLSAASTNIPGLENGAYLGTSATAPNLTNLTNPPLMPFIQALIAFGAIPVKEGLALITDHPGASSDDIYKALRQILPPHFHPALEQYMNDNRADIGLRANTIEGMIDRDPADWNAIAATGSQSLSEIRNRRAEEIDNKKTMTMRSMVKQYVSKVVDKMLGAPLGMEYEEAFAKAKNVDPTLDDAKFKQQVEQERINRLTSKKTRTMLRGSTEESTERASRMEKYGF